MEKILKMIFFLLEMIRKYCNFSNFTQNIKKLCMWTVLIRYLITSKHVGLEMLDDATIFNWKKTFLDVELKK